MKATEIEWMTALCKDLKMIVLCKDLHMTISIKSMNNGRQLAG